MSSKADITRKYKEAETAAKAALKAAQDLHFSIGQSRQPTVEQRKQMEEKLKEAFKQGHLAESWRGSYYTAYGQMDDGHGDAIEWINDEIMVPAANLGKLYKIDL